tara:strand:+ start:237 stop:362 length:126 start_codon:yes stop_codon:yes gene_type:complete
MKVMNDKNKKETPQDYDWFDDDLIDFYSDPQYDNIDEYGMD